MSYLHVFLIKIIIYLYTLTKGIYYTSNTYIYSIKGNYYAMAGPSRVFQYKNW